MCISIPARVIESTAQSALVEVDGTIRRTVLLAPGVVPQEWVLIYGGIAISALTAMEASEMALLVRKATTKT
jgi:hydrogenase assembly chaperone HypC/HupF